MIADSEAFDILIDEGIDIQRIVDLVGGGGVKAGG